MEEELLDVKRQLEDGDLHLEQKEALQTDGGVLVTAVRSRLYLSGLLSHCVPLMTQYPRMHRENWAALATLAQLTSVCCVGAEPGEQSQAFHRLFLPSVMDGLLSLAAQLMRREQLTTQVLSSERYEQIQMCEDDNVTLLCVQMWIHTCTGKDFLSEFSDDSALLLLNEAVGQLAVSSASSVGGASVRLILLMANQQEARVKPLLLSFRGLDSLLDKDWRGRGFDQEVDQLIAIIQSDARILPQACSERVRAACLIQAAWRSFQTRRRLRSLSRAVCKVRLFLQKRRAAKVPPTSSLWIGQECLSDSRRVELQRQVDQQRYTHTHTHTHTPTHPKLSVKCLSTTEAPPLSVVTATEADSFLSPSGPIAARARDSHNALLQAGRLPWWRTGGDDDTFSPAPLQELEAELGGLFVGGQIKI
ncbi:hypothetical protein KUCAC02_037500 [Chaenocephalus aceratus]|nr:hypothetical protein KUCAC02_037500 [Chaenocephalus aceratus]